MSTESSTPFLLLKTAEAPKLGRNGGSVDYVLLADPGRTELFVSIVRNNTGSGCWSTEIVPLASVERCLPGDRNQPFPAKALLPSFRGKSVNNASFLCAALKAERLIGPAADRPNQYQVVGDWSAWKSALHALDGTPYAPPSKAAGPAAEPGEGTIAAASSEMTRQDLPGDVPAEDPKAPRQGRKDRVGKRSQENVDATPAP